MKPIANDLFRPVVAETKLHPSFIRMRTAPTAEPARLMANQVFQDFVDPDGNFVEQFQTTGFDSRTFELYLFATFQEIGFKIDRSNARPDFLMTKNGITVAIEATTVNPTQNVANGNSAVSEKLTAEAYTQKLDNELPIRFGGPLFSKLKMKYWELPQCKDIPLVLAIEAFHEDGSLHYSDSALAQYLYGLRHFPDWAEDGSLIVRTSSITHHVHGTKTIPSNFFGQPDTQYISAIIFSNSGTYSKFQRLGVQTGYHRGNLHVIRRGFRYDPDPNAANPKWFAYDVDDPPMFERWAQGLVVFHNPNALHPIPKGYFTGAMDSYLKYGQVVSDYYGFQPVISQTVTILGIPDFSAEHSHGKAVIRSLLRAEFDEMGARRHEMLSELVIEKEWWSDRRHILLGVVFLDRTDDDWNFAILGRDQNREFRAIRTAVSIKTREIARMRLLTLMDNMIKTGQRIFA